MKNCYNWIAEDIRHLRAKKWKTKEDEAHLKELCELRDALHKLDKQRG